MLVVDIIGEETIIGEEAHCISFASLNLFSSHDVPNSKASSLSSRKTTRELRILIFYLSGSSQNLQRAGLMQTIIILVE